MLSCFGSWASALTYQLRGATFGSTQGLAHGHILKIFLWHALSYVAAELKYQKVLSAAGGPHRPHYSGTTLDAQARYAAGTKEILRRTFDNEPLNETDVIVQVSPEMADTNTIPQANSHAEALPCAGSCQGASLYIACAVMCAVCSVCAIGAPLAT